MVDDDLWIVDFGYRAEVRARTAMEAIERAKAQLAEKVNDPKGFHNITMDQVHSRRARVEQRRQKGHP